MTKLHISSELALPLEWMTLATVVYGARGSGKTTLGSVIAEEVTKAKQRFCAIDLKGDWYGLKSSADGKSEGIPVVVFGGDHQDVPLEEGAGAFIGETIAALEQPAILDLEHLSKGKQVRFLAAFFETLYDRNREPLLLLLDEAQRYAPQKPIDPDAAKCLGAVEDLVKLGRKHGIGPMLFTQRGSGLNKEVSELCDMLVAFRTPGPLDQDRVKDWLDANTTRAQRDEVMGALAGLPTGTAVFASGHPDLKIFGTYAVRRRETFDSSATPKVGHRRAEPKRLAKPDLEQLRMKMAAAIERQKADDPKALRSTIATLRKELLAAQKASAPMVVPTPKIVRERVEVPVLRPTDRKSLEQTIAAAHHAVSRVDSAIRDLNAAPQQLRDAIAPLRAAADAIKVELSRVWSGSSALSGSGFSASSMVAKSEPVRADARAPLFGAGTSGSSDGGSPRDATPTGRQRGAGVLRTAASPAPARTTEGITSRQQRFLDAAATLETLGVDATRETVAGWLGVHPRGGSVGEELKALVDAGLITYDRGRIIVTDAGRAAAGEIPADEAVMRAKGGLSPRQRRIFEIIEGAYPEAISRDAIAERMVNERTGRGIHPRGGSFGEDLGRLRGRGLIDYARGQARMRDYLLGAASR